MLVSVIHLLASASAMICTQLQALQKQCLFQPWDKCLWFLFKCVQWHEVWRTGRGVGNGFVFWRDTSSHKYWCPFTHHLHLPSLFLQPFTGTLFDINKINPQKLSFSAGIRIISNPKSKNKGIHCKEMWILIMHVIQQRGKCKDKGLELYQLSSDKLFKEAEQEQRSQWCTWSDAKGFYL